MNILKTRSELLRGKTIYDMNLNVGYYARVSTDKDDQLNSLENQSNYFREMINENKNWKLVGEYIDEGISGTQVNRRDNFLRMIDDSKNGKLDLIVTKEISRFSRNVVDSIKYTEELLNNGTVVYFLSDSINTIYPDSEFRLTLMSSLAQDEVRKLSERVKFGIKRMIKDGKIIGNNLTGYYRKDGKLIINESERPIIEILFNLYSTGKYSFEKISKVLYQKGYKNKKGKPYSGTSLKKFLINPRYKGYYTANLSYVENYKTHKKVPVPEKERIIYKDENIPAIISEELWNKANSLYSERKNTKNKNVLNKEQIMNYSKYTNKLICSEHNEFFIRCSSGKRKNRPVWTCNEYKKGGVLKCNSPIIVESELDKNITIIIDTYMKSIRNHIKNELLKEYAEVFDIVNNNEINQYNNKIIELNKKREKLIDLNLKGIINNDELRKRIDRVDNEIDEVFERIKKYKYIDFEKRKILFVKYIDKVLNISNNLNIYTNIFIDKIIVKKGKSRYQMDFEIHLKNKELIKISFEN